MCHHRDAASEEWYRERDPEVAPDDEELISANGMRNAKLSGVQWFFQLAVVVTMVWLRWGGI